MFQIITDATTDLSPELLAEMGVQVLPMIFTIDGQDYVNHPLKDDLSAAEFYALLREGKMPTTSQINGEAFKDFCRPLLAEGRDILYLAFSSGLSGTYQGCSLAAEDLRAEFAQRTVIVVDTLCASMGEGLLVYLACEQAKQGKTIEEVAQWAAQNRGHLAQWFTVDDLNHLHRGGRVSGGAAFVGTMLGIKPVLHVDDDGHLVPMEKVRGRRQSLDALVAHMEHCGYDFAQQTVFISHGDCAEDCKYVADQIQQRYGVKRICQNTIGPVIGAHAGPGTIALFFLAEGRN